MAKPNDAYNPTASYSPEGGSGDDYQHVQATPEDFGANVGQALQQGGQEVKASADKYIDYQTQVMKMATEAKANDTIATQWAPQVAALSSQYHQLQGMDAVAGYTDFQKNLGQMQDQFINSASSPYEKQIISTYVRQHSAQELDSAVRHQGQQLTDFENKSSDAFVNTISNNAVANYNNPDVVDRTKQQMNAQIMKHGIDRGMSPDEIEQQQRKAWGDTAEASIKRAIANGDAQTASTLYNNNIDSIDGSHRLAIDAVLHGENMRSYGANAVQAMKNGSPIPEAPMGILSQTKAQISNQATSSGVNPNELFAVASIESNFGQNVGSRGDIGQTGKPAATQAEQIANMTTAYRQATTQAETALGRTTEPWENYVCYQQGAGGGPALLKAAQDEPMSRAVDVLSPLYKNPKDALSAVVNNGGNASMTAGQFLDYIKDSYNNHLARTACMIPDGSTAPVQTPVATGSQQPAGGTTLLTQPQAPNLADAIQAPHQNPNLAFQAGSNPQQTLVNYDKVFPSYMQQAMAIPDLDKRESVIKSLGQDRAAYQASAAAYKTVVNDQAQKLAVDPSFTDITQIPAEMRASLADDPMAMSFMERRAAYNMKNVGNLVAVEKSQLGTGFYQNLSKVLSPAGDPNSITDASQLYGAAGQDGTITPPGFDRLKKLIDMKNTPDGQATLTAMQSVFSQARSQISGSNSMVGAKDPKGDKLFEQWMALGLSDYDKGIGAGKSSAQLLTPGSPDYIGNSTSGFTRTMSQRVSDIMNSQTGLTQAAAPRTLKDIVSDVGSQKLTQAQGEAEALKLGLIRPRQAQPVAPTVPVENE